MRVLITGASGFLGSRLLALLLQQRHEVACLWHRTTIKKYEHLPCSFVGENGKGIQDIFLSFQPDIVIHLAAYYVSEHSYEDLKQLIDTNVKYGVYILEAMRLSNVKNLIYAGSSWQHYRNEEYCPANLYAATKQAFSTLADYFLDISSLRILELHLYDSYGENDRRPKLLNMLNKLARQKGELDMSAGDQELHLVHVDDVANGFSIACKIVKEQTMGTRTIYRLPSKKTIKLRDLVECFNSINPHQKVKVNWGKKNYREREIFKPWEKAEILPGWHPTIDIDQGLMRLRNPDENNEN